MGEEFGESGVEQDPSRECTEGSVTMGVSLTEHAGEMCEKY